MTLLIAITRLAQRALLALAEATIRGIDTYQGTPPLWHDADEWDPKRHAELGMWEDHHA